MTMEIMLEIYTWRPSSVRWHPSRLYLGWLHFACERVCTLGNISFTLSVNWALYFLALWLKVFRETCPCLSVPVRCNTDKKIIHLGLTSYSVKRWTSSMLLSTIMLGVRCLSHKSFVPRSTNTTSYPLKEVSYLDGSAKILEKINPECPSTSNEQSAGKPFIHYGWSDLNRCILTAKEWPNKATRNMLFRRKRTNYRKQNKQHSDAEKHDARATPAKMILSNSLSNLNDAADESCNTNILCDSTKCIGDIYILPTLGKL